MEGVLEVAIFSSSKRWSPDDPRRATSSDRTHGFREPPLGSKAHPGRIDKVGVSGFREDRGQIYASVSQPGPNRHMAAVPNAACVEHVGLRLFLRPDGPVPDASRLLRYSAREQAGSPRCSDAASDSGLGRAANRGMLRLGSSATAVLDPRSRQPLWRELRSSRAGSRNTPSSDAIQVTPSHLIVFSEANLRRVLSAYVAYYNRWRPHRSLGQAVPCGEARPLPRQPCRKIAAEPVLGGLHHIYRAAA